MYISTNGSLNAGLGMQTGDRLLLLVFLLVHSLLSSFVRLATTTIEMTSHDTYSLDFSYQSKNKRGRTLRIEKRKKEKLISSSSYLQDKLLLQLSSLFTPIETCSIGIDKVTGTHYTFLFWYTPTIQDLAFCLNHGLRTPNEGINRKQIMMSLILPKNERNTLRILS